MNARAGDSWQAVLAKQGLLVDVADKAVHVLTNHGRHALADTVGASLGVAGREAAPRWEREGAWPRTVK